jgi:hypothetical protein
MFFLNLTRYGTYCHRINASGRKPNSNITKVKLYKKKNIKFVVK